jgi:hypothetical protein
VNETDQTPPRRLRLFLSDHRVLDADARVPMGQNLSTYLATRNRYVSLTDVDWLGTGERVGHMALKVAKILWAASQDSDLELTAVRRSAEARPVEVELEGGYIMAAGLPLLEGQRLSEYLQTSPPFVPLRDAELKPRRKALGDVVVNQDCIQVVREVRDPPEGASRARGAAGGERHGAAREGVTDPETELELEDETEAASRGG